MPTKPTLWITRKLSDATLARASQDYDVVLNPQDTLSSADEIVAMSHKVDAILPCHSELFTADVVARLGDRVKIVANHSVGVDHCDLDAFRSRGIVVTNTPDVLSDATAEIAMPIVVGRGSKSSRKRQSREGRTMEQLEPVIHGWASRHRETPWDYWYGKSRASDGKTCPRF